jgi:hypothetical protein
VTRKRLDVPELVGTTPARKPQCAKPATTKPSWQPVESSRSLLSVENGVLKKMLKLHSLELQDEHE